MPSNNPPAGGLPPAAAAESVDLPAALKAGVEALSGESLDGVRVHWNSAEPARLNAAAFAQGSEIHPAGDDRHVPHEAWHVVEPARGRVRPGAAPDGAVNDDAALEREADVMGARAARADGSDPGARRR